MKKQSIIKTPSSLLICPPKVGVVRRLFTCLLAVMSFGLVQAHANDQIQWSGFASLAAVTSDSETLGYRRDYAMTSEVFDGDISLEQHSNIGVQMEWFISDKWDLTGQWLYRGQRDTDLDGLTNLAFLRYSPNSQWRIRAGRLPFDLFFMTEYRDIGFAHSFAKVPSELYGIIPHRHIDGVDAEYLIDAGLDIVSFKLFYGTSTEGISAFNADGSRDFELKDTLGLAIDYKALDWEIGFNHTRTTFGSDYAAALVSGNQQLVQIPIFAAAWPDAVEDARALALLDRRGNFTSLGGQYHYEQFTFQGEIAHVHSESQTVNDINSGYVTAIYNHGSHQFFSAISHVTTNRNEALLDDVNVDILRLNDDAFALYEGADFLHDYYNLNQNTLSLGWRWNFDDSMALKVQWDRTRVYGSGSGLWQPVVETRTGERDTGSVNTLFVEISWVFQ